MTIWEILTLAAVSILGGMKAAWIVSLWKDRERSCCQVWCEKQTAVLSFVCLLLYGLVWLGYGKALTMLRSADLFYTYGILAMIDGKRRIVPDEILLCYFAGQMLMGALGTPLEILGKTLLSGMLFAGVLFAFVWIMGRKMGWGDVKLLGATAMTAGWGYTLQLLFFAMGLSLVYGIGLLLVWRKDVRTEFPFVPFLAAGMAIQMVSQGFTA